MAEQCARKSNDNSEHRVGHDTEPSEAPREDVEMGNDADEELWKQRFPEQG